MSQCQTPGCTGARYHRGICATATTQPCAVAGCRLPSGHYVPHTMDPAADFAALRTGRDLRHGAKRGPYAAGEFTPYREVTVRGPVPFTSLAGAIFTSPLGAMYGLALLVLLWLAGCA